MNDPWTPREKIKLKKFYNDKTEKEIAEKLDKPVEEVREMALKLGLFKNTILEKLN